MKEKIIVSFSGGRTSGYMCKWLQENMSHLYDLTFIYANSGQEHNKTLEFVDKCDKEFNLNLIWLQAKFNMEKGKGTSYNIVDYKTAHRYNTKNNVFENMVKKYGLPNQSYPHCTRELKLQPIKAWMRNNNLKGCRNAIGIRVDEIKRMQIDAQLFYPFIHFTPKTKEDVLDWWSKQSFDLEVEEHLGNCLWCFKKADKKLLKVIEADKTFFDFPIMLENKYTHLKTADDYNNRILFRKHRTAKDLLNGIGFKDSDIQDICVDECGTFNPNYESIEITNQLTLF